MTATSTIQSAKLPVDKNRSSIQVLRPATTEKLATTQSTTATTEMTVVRIIADGNCHIAIGSNPTATTSDIYVASGEYEYIKLDKGDKINVLGANLYVTTCD